MNAICQFFLNSTPNRLLTLEAICTIIWFVLTICNYKSENKKLKQEVSNLQQQVTKLNNENNNQTLVEQVQNKTIWFNPQEVIELYKQLWNIDKELEDKFTSKENFQEVVWILLKIFHNYDERFDILYNFINSVANQTDILYKHIQFQDSYISKIPIIEIPEDWISKVDDKTN